MPPIYVVQQGAKLRVANRRLTIVLEHEGEKPEVLQSVPIGQVSQVVLFGRIGITTPAIGQLLDLGIDVAFLTQSGQYRGHLKNGVTPHVPLRKAQYQKLDDPLFSLSLARAFVRGKLRNQRLFLMRQRSAGEGVGLTPIIGRMESALLELERKQKLTSLRGVEGSASATYFIAYRSFFPKEWAFELRNRRPPTDPVNAMLSFGYTLLARIATSAVESVGLDPYAGFLHEIVYNRPALGLDLMEEFRPLVDGVVLNVCRNGLVRPEEFVKNEQPDSKYAVYMNDSAKKRFIQTFESRMGRMFTHPGRGQSLNIRQCMIEQARLLVKAVQQQAEYQAIDFR